MACPQQSGNTISFNIPDHHRGTVIVNFTGTFQKKVTIEWGNGEVSVWNSCDCLPGLNYSIRKTNNAKMVWAAVVNVGYQNLPCAESPSPSGWQPIPNPVSLVQNCNPALNPIIVGAWLFTAPTADMGTVQVTIVVDDEMWTGENPDSLEV